MMQKKKKHYRLFDKSIQDSSTITYTLDSAIMLGIAMWFFGFLLLPLLTWFPNSYLPLPPDILMKTVQDDIQRTTSTIPITLNYAYHIEYWILVLLHKWSGGILFPIAAQDYIHYVQDLIAKGIGNEVTSRYMFATYGSWVSGLLGVYLGFSKMDPDRQVRGRRLLEGQEAIREMATISKALEIPKKGFVKQMREKLTGEYVSEEELLKELVNLGPDVPLSR
ncbi:MAG TPA: hypothetical protein VM577_07110, partial [Anaerovoracaceae bacterium]|nr:hypothetical protein [Anaerovoracaceae bacterium]